MGKIQARQMILGPTMLVVITLGLCLLVGCAASVGYNSSGSTQDVVLAAERHWQAGDFAGAVPIYFRSFWAALDTGIRSIGMSLIRMVMAAAADRGDWDQALWLCERGMEIEGWDGTSFNMDCATYRMRIH